jgi:integrase
MSSPAFARISLIGVRPQSNRQTVKCGK